MPELRRLVGKTVEIRVTEVGESAVDQLLDSDYHADCDADTSPKVPLADVRAGLASIRGNMTADFAAEPWTTSPDAGISYRMPLPRYARDRINEKADELAAPYVGSTHNLGLVFGVLCDDERLVLGYGQTSKGDFIVPSEQTLFSIGSLTNVFTGLLLADMVQRGDVQLDDPLRKFLPATVSVPTYRGQEITLYHLATHTSGLPRLSPDLDQMAKDGVHPGANYTIENLYQGLSRCRLRRPPGRRAVYSVLGMSLLANVLVRVGGRSRNELVLNRICRPLSLQDTVFRLSADQEERLALGHSPTGEPVPTGDQPAQAGLGHLHSTAEGLLAFLQANLDPAATRLQQALEMCQTVHRLPLSPWRHVWDYIGATAASAVGLVIQWAWPGTGWWGFLLLCLLPVAVSAVRWGLRPGLVAALVSVLGHWFLVGSGLNWLGTGLLAGLLAVVCSLRYAPVVPGAALAWEWQPLGDGTQILWQNSRTGGYSSWIGFVPESQTAVVALSNSANAVDALGRQFLEYLHEKNLVWAHVARTRRNLNAPRGPHRGEGGPEHR